MKDYLQVYIESLKKQEDSIGGAWFHVPLNIESVCEVLNIQTDEDYLISACDGFELKEQLTLQDINTLGLTYMLEVEGTPIEKELKAIKNAWFDSYEELFEYVSCLKHYDCESLKEVAHELLESENSEMNLHIPIEYRRFFDYEQYVSELEQSGRFLVTKNGVFQLHLSKQNPIIESKMQACRRSNNREWLDTYERLQHPKGRRESKE